MARKTTWPTLILSTLLATAADRVNGQMLQQVPLLDSGTQLQLVREFDREKVRIGSRSLAPDPDGFFWVASDTGLYRFDGEHFHSIDSRPVSCVARTSDGWVWAGGSDGLRVYRNGTVRTLLREKINSLVVAGDSVVAGGDGLWRGTINGLSPLAARPTAALALAGDRSAWFACANKICSVSPSGVLSKITPPPMPAGSGTRPHFSPEWSWAIRDDSGNVWAWNQDITVRVSPDGATKWYNWPASSPDHNPVPYRTPDGDILIPGLAMIRNGEIFRLRPPIGGSQDYALFANDTEGNLWMASPGGGLALISSRSWVYGWSSSVIPGGCNSVSQSSVRLLASCAGGVFAFQGHGDVTHEDWQIVRGTQVGSPAWAADELADGTIWTILSGRGIIHLGPDGRELGAAWRGVRPTRFDFRTLFHDADKGSWVGAKGGAFRLTERGLDRYFPLDSDAYATSFATGPDGSNWLGSNLGIFKKKNSLWKLEIPVNALLNPRVRSLAVGHDSTLWVSYRGEFAFSRFTRDGGVWTRRDFGIENGYVPSSSTAMLVDRQGWVWRATPEGLYVSDGVHLEPEAWVALRAVNNLPGDAISPFGLFQDRSGDIWVAVATGIARVTPDPRWFLPPVHRPPLRITAVRWHGMSQLTPAPNQSLDGPGGDLTLDFAQWPGVSLRPSASRHRLLPVEKAWEPGNFSVTYPALKAGNYTFEIQSADGATTAWAFQVAPLHTPFWPWLAASSLVAMFGAWRLFRGSLFHSEYWKAKEAFLAARAVEPDARSHTGEIIAERYEILHQVGEGGFAGVWKARRLGDGSFAAVKFLHAEGEIEDWQATRFQSETEALRRLDAPGIVHFLDSGRLPGGQFWMAMAWIDGPDLRRFLQQGPVARDRVARWVRQMGRALGTAHAEGVLHRDLKPENILVAQPDTADEHIVIVDFGAAAIMTGSRQHSALLLGSFYYMAPERVQGRSSPATDVYGLSAVAFELLTGVRYAGVSASSGAEMRKLLAGFPPGVADSLASGLDYSPAARPQDIRIFAEELAEGLTSG